MNGWRLVIEPVTGPWTADEEYEVENVGRIVAEALAQENYLGLIEVIKEKAVQVRRGRGAAEEVGK